VALPATLRVTVERPENEPLLWADAVAGAVRTAVTGTVDEHFAILTTKIELTKLQL
jgi:hypothetical protein